MADAILGHRRIVGKPMPIAFNTTSTAGGLPASTDLASAALVNGLVQHDLVDPDIQVAILALIDETGSAALEDIVAALEGHPKPAGAAFAMVAAGILEIENGIVDANSRLSRVRRVHDDAGNDEGVERTSGPMDKNVGPGTSSGAQADGSSLRRINVPTIYVPVAFCIPGADRTRLRDEDVLSRPGIYAAFWGRDVYVGASKAINKRLTKGRHVIAPRPADRIIAIVDGTDQLSWDGAQVAERLLYRSLTASTDLKPRHDEPSGGQVDATTYELVHDFVETAVAALRREGLLAPVVAPDTAAPPDAMVRDPVNIFSTGAPPSMPRAGLYLLIATEK